MERRKTRTINEIEKKIRYQIYIRNAAEKKAQNVEPFSTEFEEAFMIAENAREEIQKLATERMKLLFNK